MTTTTTDNAATGPDASQIPGRFDRGRVQIEGTCGCQWHVQEVNPPPDKDAEIVARVCAAVARHAEETSHAPTFVEIRESYYRPPGFVDA